MKNKVYTQVIKPVMDFVIALLSVIILSPFLLIMTLILWIVNRGRCPFFVQERIGKNGKIFKIYKFRTMTDKRDQNGNLLPDMQRLTPFGRLIRTWSLDELPQLWNVLRCEMAIVGPRPMLAEYLPLFSASQMRRHDILPGITGWAQCHGRNNISWGKKFEMDLWYLENISIATDFKIILKTFRTVLSRRDINTPGFATVEKFNGHN